MNKIFSNFSFFLVLFAFAVKLNSQEVDDSLLEKLGEYRLLALSPADNRVVIKSPEGEMHTLAAMEQIPGVGFEIVKILPNEIQLRAPSSSDAIFLRKVFGDKALNVRVMSRRPKTEGVDTTHLVEASVEKRTSGVPLTGQQ